ncbi:glycoside hydrolase family 61 protein [Tulasnella calospora MUT 4182]|uniref:lytic cellulose monooxygenase (C4-dehydrogenating) n=1 Tax=Tulasnella calospora MUT 4182 TaxID=1051891 RepID=A0A0C3QX71_9AGAM|nr:glycoside hydrolase family 61 protein [Tulasnella calospora MUT 4182]
MKFFAAALALAATVVSPVAAHYRWTSLIVNGTTTTAYQYVRQSTIYNSPVTDVSSSAFTCNQGATAASGIAWTKAGNPIGFALDQAIYHSGTLNAYMAKVPAGQTAATWNGAGNAWFKVGQITPKTNGGTSITFPTDNLTQYTFTVPSKLPDGDYLVRIEHIALHAASAFQGAQFYISCGQIHVFGGGSTLPSSYVSIPGVYNGHEPGIQINIYYPIPPTYTQPGPAVWS